MAKRKSKDETPVEQADYSFFKSEVEGDGIRICQASEMIDPEGNPTGSYNLDFDLVTPFPEGRITEIFGPEQTCKTTLVLEALGQALLRGKKCLYVNMEKNLNMSLMRTVRTLRPFLDQIEEGDKECPLWVVNADNGEQGFEAMKKFVSMNPGGVAALDSIDAAQPEAVLSGEIGTQKVGNLAKLMSDAMRKLIGVADKNRVALIFVNQLREKMTMYGNPDVASGGRALPYYASQRISLKKPRKDDIIKDEDGNKIGVVIRYQVVKNKLAPDGNEGEFYILLKNGIFREKELLTQCLNFGVLQFGGRGGKQILLPV